MVFGCSEKAAKKCLPPERFELVPDGRRLHACGREAQRHEANNIIKTSVGNR